MRTFLFLLFFSNSCISYCQLSSDSLMRICLANYYLEKNDDFTSGHCFNSKLYKRVSFGDYFDCYNVIEIYELTEILTHNLSNPSIIDTSYYVSRECANAIYLVNSEDGQIISPRGYDTFNEIINSCYRKVSNLEKCYLYLLFNQLTDGGFINKRGYSAYNEFGNSLSAISALLFNCSPQSKTIPCWFYEKADNEMKKSDVNCIKLFTCANRSKDYFACGYTFIFDTSNNISEIRTEYFN